MAESSVSCGCTPQIYSKPIQKTGCNNNLTGSDPLSIKQRQQIIQKTVRTSSSNYISNISSVVQKSTNDPSIVTLNVPRRMTRSMPGRASAPGNGVEKKHNSYDRYLAKKKGKFLISDNNVSDPVSGGKTQFFTIVRGSSNKCKCPS